MKDEGQTDNEIDLSRTRMMPSAPLFEREAQRLRSERRAQIMMRVLAFIALVVIAIGVIAVLYPQ